MPRAVILTALEVEFLAARAHLRDATEDVDPRGTRYVRGRFDADGAVWDVALVQIGMGNPRAALEAERAIARFSPDVALFVGVAGGIKDVALGDVVAAQKVYGYEFGKAAEEFRQRPEVALPSYPMEQAALAVSRDRLWQTRILPELAGRVPDSIVKPIAAGSKVVAATSSAEFELLRTAYSDAVAVEMEGHGFLQAAHANRGVDALVVRGISDLVDDKAASDEAGWQEVASRHAAAFAFEVLATYRPPGGFGASTASPFASVARFFEPFQDPTKLFSHAYPLVGRDEHVESLVAFASSPERVAILSGGGGLGKSKILKEGLDQFEAMRDGPQILVLRDPASLDAKALNDLPAGPLILGVDDAHRVPDLSVIFEAARKQSDRVKLVLATRPYGVPGILDGLRLARFTTDELRRLPEVEPLEPHQILALAREVLGEEHANLAEHLVRFTGDSPLITVVGARLLVRDQLDPVSLVAADQVRDEIFGRFRDVLLGNLGDGVDPTWATEVLRLVAALGPFRAHYRPLVDEAAAFLGMPVDELNRALSALTEAGALSYSGRTYRIIPERLSEFVLREALITATGEPTHYADAVFEGFQQLFLEDFLDNIAGLQPDAVVRFSEATIEGGGLDQPELTLSAALSGAPLAPRETLPRVLRRVASHRPTAPKALDLLWQLAKDDERPTNPRPDHPMRVLEDFATIEPTKEPWVYEAVLDAVDRWAREPDAFSHRFAPLDVLDKLLDQDPVWVWGAGSGLGMWNDGPSAVGFGDFRRRGIRILTGLTRNPDPVVQHRALASLLKAMWTPRELDVADNEAEARRRENELIVRAVRELLEGSGSALLAYEAEEQIRKMRPRAEAERDRPYLDLVATAPADLNSRLVRYLRFGQVQYLYFPEEIQRDLEALYKVGDLDACAVVQNLVNSEDDAASIKARLEREMGGIARYGVETRPEYILGVLARDHPTIAASLSDLVVTDPGSPLVPHLGSLLLPVRRHDEPTYRRIVDAAIETTDHGVLAALARGLSWFQHPGPFERAAVGRIAGLRMPELVPHIVEALSHFPDEARGEAVAVAGTIDIGSDPDLGNSLCEALADGPFDPVGPIPADVIDVLQQRLVPVRRIADVGSATHGYVGRLATQDPERAVELFVERIRHGGELRREDEESDYRPVPFVRLTTPFALDEADPAERRRALDRVAELALEPHGLYTYDVPSLFALLANGFDDLSIQALDDLIEDEGRYGVRAAVRLLREAPKRVLFDRPDYLDRLLAAADRAGEEEVSYVRAALLGIAWASTDVVVGDEPPPVFTSTKDRAMAAAAHRPEGSQLRAFYEALAQDSERQIGFERQLLEAREL